MSLDRVRHGRAVELVEAIRNPEFSETQRDLDLAELIRLVPNPHVTLLVFQMIRS